MAIGHRTCGTPGCRFRDGHDGPHSHESHGRRFRKQVWKRPRCVKADRAPATAVKTVQHTIRFEVNDFQVGIDKVREAIGGQRGVRLHMPKSAFCGHWPDTAQTCTGKLIGPSYEGRFVAEALFDGDAAPTLLTSSSLMLTDTHVFWRKPHMDATALLRDKCATNAKHVHAMARARDMYSILLDLGIDLRDRIVLTLDGIGTNRVSGEDVLASLDACDRPVTLTLEMNPDVALAQRIALGFGPHVRFTGADPTMSFRSRSLKHAGPPTIEDVLVTPCNTVLSEEEKRNVAWLNLDYCGGPPKNHSGDCVRFMTRCLAHLPRVQMIAVTMARRNHPDLDETFDDYFPVPYGFSVKKTYTDNVRVVCKLYVRDRRVPRHLSIPGHWWRGVECKSAIFDGVVVAREGRIHDVYVPVDALEYKMRSDAVAAYADDSA